MLTKNHIAFKEWASIVNLLGGGEQILILRKGGIHEKGKRFDVAHDEFFLFPTFEHQNPADLTPAGARVLKKILDKKPDPAIVPVQYYCMVDDSFWIANEKALERLEPLHAWSRECIKKRFEWGDEKGLFGIIVRIFSYPRALPLENLKRYGGCRSWVELEKPLETISLKPVLSDKAFQENKEKIRTAIGVILK